VQPLSCSLAPSMLQSPFEGDENLWHDRAFRGAAGRCRCD
jgi:hypothetical protein